MTIIKKIIFIISVILFAIPTYAVDMCASDNAIVIVLDPNIHPTSSSHDAPTFTWRAVFSYGTITGISACLNYNSSQSDQANNGTVFGGEQKGLYCWCKMTHPAVSKWVYTGTNTADCATSCTGYCKSYVGGSASSNVGKRGALFKTITN